MEKSQKDNKINIGIMVKPTGWDCNLDCDYCYYKNTKKLYPNVKKPQMSLKTFEKLCEQYSNLNSSVLRFDWQGGEPTLMGLDFFKEAMKIQSKCFKDKKVENTLQTNGILLNDEWCKFFKKNNFLIGLSVDGPKKLNKMRHFLDRRPSYKKTINALNLLREYEIDFNALIVINKINVKYPKKIFNFLKQNEVYYSQFVPCTEYDRKKKRLTKESITSKQYADFTIRLFDAWIKNDDPSYYIRKIDNWIQQYFGFRSIFCEFNGNCSGFVTIEHNGDVYPCDFFVEEKYQFGNIYKKSLKNMLKGKIFMNFLKKAQSLPSCCKKCKWLKYCYAGCFRHREKLNLGINERPYLCEAKKKIFEHVFSKLKKIEEKEKGRKLHIFLNKIREDLEFRKQRAIK